MVTFTWTRKTLTFAFVGTMAFVACGEYSAPNTFQQLRCENDGFCLSYVKDKNWSGAYREKAQEIHIDVAYSSGWESMFNGASNYSVRFRALSGHTMFEGGLYKPKQWVQEKQEEVDKVKFSLDEIRRYNQFLVRMKENLPKERPDEVEEESWELVHGYLEDITKTLKEGGQRDRTPTEGIENPRLLEPGGEKILPLLKPTSHPFEMKLFGSGSSGGDHHGALEVAPTSFVERPGFEFYQTMKLYSQPWSIWGIETKKHHTATYTEVWGRPLGSNEPWDRVDNAEIANHGAGPRGKKMKEYATCASFPVTKGYFVWKGECEGEWATHHLCNDDTAYQIYHAYGEHNGHSRCLGKRRDHRPWCDKPW